jgi:DNA replication and repair protein RecF
MLIHSLYLHQFRNYNEAQIQFGPHVNLIYGANAQGKTTLLEAIHYFMLGRSFRSLQNTELIKHGSSAFFVECLFCKHGVEQRLRIRFDGKDKKIFYNSTQLPSTANLLGIIQGVVMTPDDILLIKGPPQLRRQFLDIQISQIDPLYVHHLLRYNRAMRQRNQLLKAQELLTIETWEHEMSHSAAYLIIQRQKAVFDLKQHSHLIHQTFTHGRETLDISYKCTVSSEVRLEDIQKQLLSLFQKNRPRELILGYTLTGPHKEDLTFTINGKDVQQFASEGQQRSCMISLRLAEWTRLQQQSESTPLLLIDDVGLSLDQKRKNDLLQQLFPLGQVFLTSTDFNLIPSFQPDHTLLHVHEGRILKQ